MGIAVSVVWGTALLHIHRGPDERGGDNAIRFSVDGNSTLGRYASRLVYLRRINRSRPRLQPHLLEESAATLMSVEAAGCDSPVTVYGEVELDARWLAAVRKSRLHQKLILPTNLRGDQAFVIAHPNVGGKFAFAFTGKISDFVAELSSDERLPVEVKHQPNPNGSGTTTTITGYIPTSWLPVENFSLGLYDDEDLSFHFHAPWISPRGFQSCYLSLPRLVNDSSVDDPLSWESLDTGVEPTDAAERLEGELTGPAIAQTQLDVTRASVDLQDTNPAPDTNGLGRTWSCARRGAEGPTPARAPDCHATVVLTAPNEAAELQVRLLLVAALLSASVAGFFTGLWRLASRRGPT